MSSTIIVVPCYNEATRLDCLAFRRFLAAGHPQRFLFVDDGSADDTAAVLQSLCETAPDRCELHRLPKNLGKAEAVRLGMLHAWLKNPDFVGYWDADLATPLEEIPGFVDLLQRRGELEMVMGSRVRLLGRQIERRPARHYLGRLFATVASLVLRIPVYDTQCGAKMFRVSPRTRRLFERPFLTRWIFDVEIIARLLSALAAEGEDALDGRICEIPLAAWRDVPGSKVRAVDFVVAAMEMWRIYAECPHPTATVSTAEGRGDPDDQVTDEADHLRAA